MLRITGDCLDVTSETVNGPSGSFVSTTIHLLSGLQVERVRVGRDFLPADLPKAGDKNVDLAVVVSAYAGRNGAGYRLTALERIKPGVRAAAV